MKQYTSDHVATNMCACACAVLLFLLFLLLVSSYWLWAFCCCVAVTSSSRLTSSLTLTLDNRSNGWLASRYSCKQNTFTKQAERGGRCVSDHMREHEK